MKRKELTNKEREWLEDLQAVLDRCPSKRLGFYTMGDRDISVYDRRFDKHLSKEETDFCIAVNKFDAHLEAIIFPAPVHSTAG